jgi:hypothetical protein
MFNTAIPRISDFATSSSHDCQNKIVNCRPNRSKKNDLLTGEATHTERSIKMENKNTRMSRHRTRAPATDLNERYLDAVLPIK